MLFSQFGLGLDSWRKALHSPTIIGLAIYQQHFFNRVAVQGYCIPFRLAPDSQDLWFCQSAAFYLVYLVPLVLTVINTNYNFADKKKKGCSTKPSCDFTAQLKLSEQLVHDMILESLRTTSLQFDPCCSHYPNEKDEFQHNIGGSMHYPSFKRKGHLCEGNVLEIQYKTIHVPLTKDLSCRDS